MASEDDPAGFFKLMQALIFLQAIQTVAILDANSGLVPVSWEDEVLMEKEVYIGMAPKSHHGPGGKKERGRTPGPSSDRKSVV